MSNWTELHGITLEDHRGHPVLIVYSERREDAIRIARIEAMSRQPELAIREHDLKLVARRSERIQELPRFTDRNVEIGPRIPAMDTTGGIG